MANFCYRISVEAQRQGAWWFRRYRRLAHSEYEAPLAELD